ncbi:LPS export ABC transporter ATP-binding protein [Cerasicoccus maritimus]|uniref:LPS export ABC transporter ATP-binding protein n=1 Tax=Cerasicoccus maritimus TaxID=490089 RepID=UPI0028526B35|nr:LPS export ABC transporter ATP-binding protein [Cerasicoccus maritimus]
MEAAEVAPQPATTEARTTIHTKGLVKVYGKREVVSGVDLNVNSGEVVGLLGPNGAGKTTTFYMIVGLVPATRGQVFLDDKDVTKLPMYRRARLGVGYLPQEASVFRKLTVYDNIMAITQTLSVPRKERHDYVMAHLEELGLDHLAKQKAYTLSGGERRRLEITRAMVSRPRFMLLDEPFSGVDPKSVDEVQDIILGLKSKNIGILITDHNVRETLKIVDRAYLIHQGKVLSEGTSEFLVNDEKSREYYLGRGFTL